MKETNYQLKSPNFVDDWPILPLKIHIPIITYSSENHHAEGIIITKAFLELAEGTMALIVWQNIATDCVRPKTNTTLFEVTRQDKISRWANIPESTAAGCRGET